MEPTYHIVSHSHWDREWYKTFEQFRSMLVVMVDDLIDLLDRDRDFASFLLDGQTSVLEDYLEVRPEQREVLARLISKGRIATGPWFVLADEFLVSAEALVRNLLRGGKTAKEFGGGMMVGYLPDTFGHIAMMPAILRGFDIDTALLYRGFGGEAGQNVSEYQWEAPDGCRVLMIHLFRNGYSTGYFHQDSEDEIISRFSVLKSELDERATTPERLLMNGGDHHWPDPKLPRTLDLLRQTFEVNIVHSTLSHYIDEVKRKTDGLVKVPGELRFGYRYAFVVNGGVYSSRMYIKQRNWRCQNLLQRYAEPLGAYARALGHRSHLPLVRHAWKRLMQNHPHDSICGCSIDPVHREMMTRFRAVEDVGSSVVDACLAQIVPEDDRASGDDRFVFFFNPSPYVRTDVAEAEIRFYRQDVVVGLNPDVRVKPMLRPVAGFRLTSPSGEEIPFQITGRREGYDITYSHYNYPKQTRGDCFTVLVDPAGVPPLGFTGVEVHRSRRFPRYTTRLKAGHSFLENERLRVEVDHRGRVTILDKVSRLRYPALHVFEDSGDAGDEYNYSYPERDVTVRSDRGKARISVVEKGPLRVALRVETTMKVPATGDRRSRGRKTVDLPVSSDIRLTKGSRLVEFETTVCNTAQDHRLRVLFSPGIRTERTIVDSQFCTVEREQKQYDLRDFTIEHPARVAPMQRFVTVRDATRGMTLLSDGLPEYELCLDRDRSLALTLLRCVGLLAGEDLLTRPGGKAGWHNETPDAQCPGTHSFRYAILVHTAEEATDTRMLNAACESFHLPLLAFRRKIVRPAAMHGSFLSIDSQRLTCSAIKEAEDGDGLVVRLYNPGPAEERATLQCTREIERARSVRLDEEAIAPIAVEEKRKISFVVPPHGIFSLKLHLVPTDRT